MRAQGRRHCCEPLAAALSEEMRAAGGSSCLVVREDAHGALYFRITTDAQELSDSLVNEPAPFCPFCGTRVSADADTPPSYSVISEDDDEELTVLACTATLVGA